MAAKKDREGKRRPGRPRSDAPRPAGEPGKREALFLYVEPNLKERLERYRKRKERDWRSIGHLVSMADCVRGAVEEALKREFDRLCLRVIDAVEKMSAQGHGEVALADLRAIVPELSRNEQDALFTELDKLGEIAMWGYGAFEALDKKLQEWLDQRRRDGGIAHPSAGHLVTARPMKRSLAFVDPERRFPWMPPPFGPPLNPDDGAFRSYPGNRFAQTQ